MKRDLLTGTLENKTIAVPDMRSEVRRILSRIMNNGQAEGRGVMAEVLLE